ncbi:MAG TPA: crosslink repair DNA glycosylase YcaQ family protein [Solirubrobacteraceae bacterium]|jgi:hypothetical protein|nr:crosslink repair DNA glycosylase YcaQ family protein [Solirubrobacteraceae bacterium]
MSSQSVVLGRLASQLLTGPKASDPVAVVRQLLAVQGQDPCGARLAIRVRSEGLSAKDVDRALSECRDWLGEPVPVDRELALAELGRRYLVGHAPADDRDLAKWSGLPLRDVRAGLAAIAPELHHRESRWGCSEIEAVCATCS